MDKNEIFNMSENEKNRLILPFDTARYSQYEEIIKGDEEYKKIIDEMPRGLSKIEKAYYIYSRLAKIVQENLIFVYNPEHTEIYFGLIDEKRKGTCRQINELYITMLVYAKIIDKYFITRENVDSIIPHTDAIISIDGNLYITNLIRDTVNARSGHHNLKFGFKFDSEELTENLTQYIEHTVVGKEQAQRISNMLIQTIYNKNLDFEREITKYNKNAKRKISMSFVKKRISKIRYAKNIEKEIGKLSFINKRSSNKQETTIETLDVSTGNGYTIYDVFHNKLINNEFLDDFLVYKLIPTLVPLESEIRSFYSGKDISSLQSLSFDENLELDISIVFKLLKTISCNRIDKSLYIKYLRAVLGNIYAIRYNDDSYYEWVNSNFKSYTLIKENGYTGLYEDCGTIISISKDDDNNIYYLYTLESKEFQRKSQREVTKYIRDNKLYGGIRLSNERIDLLSKIKNNKKSTIRETYDEELTERL